MERTVRYQGAIIRDHHILLIKLYNTIKGRGHWLIPGGGREDGESEEQCVRREMREETHLDVAVERLLLDEAGRPGGIYRRYKTYLCRPVAGEARPGCEPEPEAARIYIISDVRWFDLRDETTWGVEVASEPVTYLVGANTLCVGRGRLKTQRVMRNARSVYLSPSRFTHHSLRLTSYASRFYELV